PATENGHRLRALARDRHLPLLRVRHAPGRTEQRLAEDMLERADPAFVRILDVVAGAAGVEPGPGADREQLLRLGVVGEEADVLLDGELLLPDERNRRPGERLAGRERRDAVQVGDR